MTRVSQDERLAEAERDLALKGSKEYKKLFEKQMKHLHILEKELPSYMTFYNFRVLYFRALQEFSDDVADPEFEESKIERIQLDIDKELKETNQSIRTESARLSYLRNFLLREGQENTEICAICKV